MPEKREKLKNWQFVALLAYITSFGYLLYLFSLEILEYFGLAL